MATSSSRFRATCRRFPRRVSSRHPTTSFTCNLAAMWLPLGLILGCAQPAPSTQRPGVPVVWSFEWEAPPSCPSRAEVIDGVRSYLPEIDDPPTAPTRADLRVAVSVAADDAGWTATLRMSDRDAESERRFSAPNCVELAEATALITAVAL